jgi:acylphosphatase
VWTVEERRQVFYSGRVQGVGFRYTAQSTARSFAVTGWVRNLADGRVELAVEGKPAAVDAYLARIAEIMGTNIRGVEQHVEKASGEFRGFEIER